MDNTINHNALFMSEQNVNQSELHQKFEELSNKYKYALKNDLEFEQLKAIYLELKEIRQKLTEFNINTNQ